MQISRALPSRDRTLLDTRSKIIALTEARKRAQSQPTRWVTGYFDPLLAAHVRRQRECVQPGEALVVEIVEPPNALLGREARAELVAALDIVDYVVLGEGDAAAGSAIDEGFTERFLEHVRERHRGNGG